MFTPNDRTRLRAQILGYASRDRRISGAAITGSAAEGREDQWSDIDLAFGVNQPEDLTEVLLNWTAYMNEQHGALHHLDIRFAAWTYRVFLLPGSLQVDLAFVPAAEFRALSPAFRLVFGKAGEPGQVPSSEPTDILGFGWLYALHARSSIARQKLWQAEYMISSLRDTALALACIRHGVPAVYGRGLDMLPAAIAAQFEGSLVRQLDVAELSRAFRVALDGLLSEIRHVDGTLAKRLDDERIA